MKHTEGEIKTWVENNKTSMPEVSFTPDELSHIARCMHHISQWYYEDYPIGKFLTAVVKDDFCEACFQADNINRKSLFLYALFLANKLPLDYQVKARRG